MSEDDTADRDEDWFERAISDDAGADDRVGPDVDDPRADAGNASDRTADRDESDGPSEPTAGDRADTDVAADELPADDPDWGGASDDRDGPVPAETDPAADDDASPFADDADPTGGGDGLFEDDFATAFGGAGGDEFDDANFDSPIPRIDVGIEGLDNMIRGGVPERHLVVAIGSAGTGKTTFGLQFLQHGLSRGDDCVFITLEQSKSAILDTAGEHGWDFAAHEDDDRLAVIDLDPIEMANSLDNIRGELPDLVADFDADRLVLDSVSLLEMMYDDQARRRTEVYDFTRSLKRAGVTTLLTSEADEDNPYASRHGIIEYLTDAVFILRYVRGETKETRLAVEIRKIRNANHSREAKPYELTDEGISVYEQANIF